MAEEALKALDEQEARIETERASVEAEARSMAEAAETRARDLEENYRRAEVKLREESEARARAEHAEAEARARAAALSHEGVERAQSEPEARIREVEKKPQQSGAGSQPASAKGASIHRRAWGTESGGAPVLALQTGVGSLITAINLFFKGKTKLLGYGVIIFLLIVALVWVGATIFLLLHGET
jgi:VIT1/CCC1 family predicted Fe2+/Mn2+ transporter